MAWIESRTKQQVGRISSLVDQIVDGQFEIVFVDDADGFGELGAELLSKIQNSARANRKIVVGCRTVKSHLFDGVSNLLRIDDFRLSNRDVNLLIELLRDKRAIPNRRISDADLRDLLVVDSGRQLLAGMIQATSGVAFKRKVETECSSLNDSTLFIYGLICLVSSQGESITEEQLLVAASGEVEAVTGYADFHRLLSQKLVRSIDGVFYETRHRVIAEHVMLYLNNVGLLGAVIRAAVIAFAAAAGHLRDNSLPERRILVRLLGHTFLRDNLSAEDTRSVYVAVEEKLDDDFHYWLQRGSFELEKGDMELSLPALMAARTLAGGESDRKVLTTYARLRLKLALHTSTSESLTLATEAVADLHKVMAIHGVNSPHTYVIVCEEAVPWLESSAIGRLEKLELAATTRGFLTSPVAVRLEFDNVRFGRVRAQAIAKLDLLITDLKS